MPKDRADTANLLKAMEFASRRYGIQSGFTVGVNPSNRRRTSHGARALPSTDVALG